ncbi:uncharacterized protein MONOS_10788 [Monocercomonoides exilis]|uniref:uncharacterized protein n=1 Tax=Monocercomonoides exilis TaxID=2049356 RepID=UPI003559ADA0|nr:hypothetical protein MONOS_10788 [Monocercomonoides exilis]|eukprot:MONOS_10788.1-p1 / transcript=MONOS_10788.1 / gene=MONOS_10788 / organism=Monocercomonoides_exilis_PA203 / gene_product=unspecified product / transcript_product=unspecified product / location=Mono_scaffold00505:12116-13504(+) / protein_length=463 / sequence_SO=supercontig / SO=protein_coding / is_pseudo=false
MSLCNNLKQNIRKCIAEKDINSLLVYKDICDHLHEGEDEYKGYKSVEIPSDTLYEEMVRLIRLYQPDSIKDEEGEIESIWMGSIPKFELPQPIEEAILLPKFDGCSCGVFYKRFEKLEICTACSRNFSSKLDMKVQEPYTNKVRSFTSNLTNKLNESSSFLFDGKFHVSDIREIYIRGEICMKIKNRTTTTLYSGFPAKAMSTDSNEVFTEMLPNLQFVPYEIMKIVFDVCNEDEDNCLSTSHISMPDSSSAKKRSEGIILEYVPTQEEVLRFFSSIGVYKYPWVHRSITGDSLSYIKSLYEEWNSSLTEPLDGVVYCSKDWCYHKPKVIKKYGKYAWKPSSEATTTLREINQKPNKMFEVYFDEVEIEGKKIKKASMKTVRNHKVGDVVTVWLNFDGSIVKIVDDDENKQTKRSFNKLNNTEKEDRGKEEEKKAMEPPAKDEVIQKDSEFQASSSSTPSSM